MNRLIIFLFLVLLFTSMLSAQNYFHGKLTEDTKWSGTIYLDGDVTIPANIRLFIEPGTKIIIEPNKDVLKHHIEIALATADGRTDQWISKNLTLEVVSKIKKLIMDDINDQKNKLEKEFDGL